MIGKITFYYTAVSHRCCSSHFSNGTKCPWKCFESTNVCKYPWRAQDQVRMSLFARSWLFPVPYVDAQTCLDAWM